MTADDVATLFDPGVTFLWGRSMPRRPIGNQSYLWIPSSTKVTAHSLREQLDGAVARSDAYDQEKGDLLDRRALKAWRQHCSQKSGDDVMTDAPRTTRRRRRSTPRARRSSRISPTMKETSCGSACA